MTTTTATRAPNVLPPAFVTFTGVDQWTDLGRLRALSDRYPVEWAILFSPAAEGDKPRYPSMFAVGRITHALKGEVGLAAHLCGDYASTVLRKARCPDLNSWIDCRFGRFQVNTSDPSADPGMVAEFASMVGGTGILQARGAFPSDDRVAWLQDASGGRGIVPASWPEPPTEPRLVGYAGGIGPDEVADVVAGLGAARDPRQPYWIDMETKVRTDDRLDLDRCESVLRVVYPER